MTKKQDHYASLGVSRDAKADQIKRAFRSKAQKKHPDKGGDKEEYQAIQKAYDVLSNPSSKERYDRTGEDKPIDKHAAMMNDLIGSLLQNIEKIEDVDHNNLLDIVRHDIEKAIAYNNSSREKLLHMVAKTERVAKRLKTKQKDNVFIPALNAKLLDYKQKIQECDDMIGIQHDMLNFLKDYSYKVDIAKPEHINTLTIGGRTFKFIQ